MKKIKAVALFSTAILATASTGVQQMDIKSDVLAIIDDLFMEDVSDMMDEDLFDAGVLDSMGTVELIVELESHFDIDIPISEFGRDDWNTPMRYHC